MGVAPFELILPLLVGHKFGTVLMEIPMAKYSNVTEIYGHFLINTSHRA